MMSTKTDPKLMSINWFCAYKLLIDFFPKILNLTFTKSQLQTDTHLRDDHFWNFEILTCSRTREIPKPFLTNPKSVWKNPFSRIRNQELLKPQLVNRFQSVDLVSWKRAYGSWLQDFQKPNFDLTSFVTSCIDPSVPKIRYIKPL